MLTGDVIPSIPLFTLAGYIISEGKSGERLVRLFRTLFGWLPGGLALMSILICAFLTTFTGASGVTIIAVGTLLLFILKDSGYNERFGRGLLTASGSIGLLFPPSLPVILYGVVSLTNIKQMFVGGILPGAVPRAQHRRNRGMEGAQGQGARAPPSISARRFPRSGSPSGRSCCPSSSSCFSCKGITTLVETGAVAVHLRARPGGGHPPGPEAPPASRRLPEERGHPGRDPHHPCHAPAASPTTSWMRRSPCSSPSGCAPTCISPYVFLLLLNLVLIIKGFFIDIFSAITIVVPLIAPLGVAYGINPVHLGIIFLANLELGYLTPPLGLNLFLASYRFEKPLVQIYRDVLPFQLVMLAAVLIITYVPWMTTALLTCSSSEVCDSQPAVRQTTSTPRSLQERERRLPQLVLLDLAARRHGIGVDEEHVLRGS